MSFVFVKNVDFIIHNADKKIRSLGNSNACFSHPNQGVCVIKAIKVFEPVSRNAIKGRMR